MTAVPVIGPLPADSDSTGSSTEAAELQTTKVTEVRKAPGSSDAQGELKERTIEKTPRKSSTTSIYDIYRSFLQKNPSALKYSDARPSSDAFVPGTLKRHGLGFYYIQKNYKTEYTTLCERLFTQSRGKASAKTLKADVDTLKAQGAFIPSAR
jgi:hypothetical protein